MQLSRFVNWGLSNVTCDTNRHSAECTNADDLFGTHILSCHLVSEPYEKTISTCTVDHRVVAQHTYPYNRSPINEVDWFAISDGSVYPKRYSAFFE